MFNAKKNFAVGEGDALVRELSERCTAATITQLGDAARQMNIAQLRGYVRVHAWSLVWIEVQDAAQNRQVRLTQTHEIASRTLEQVVHNVTTAYTAAPTVAMPAPHIGRRAA
jgi:hypothetical protein